MIIINTNEEKLKPSKADEHVFFAKYIWPKKLHVCYKCKCQMYDLIQLKYSNRYQTCWSKGPGLASSLWWLRLNSCDCVSISTTGSNTDITVESLQALQFFQHHRGGSRGNGGWLSGPFIQPVPETGSSLHLCTSKVLSVCSAYQTNGQQCQQLESLRRRSWLDWIRTLFSYSDMWRTALQSPLMRRSSPRSSSWVSPKTWFVPYSVLRSLTCLSDKWVCSTKYGTYDQCNTEKHPIWLHRMRHQNRKHQGGGDSSGK